MKKIISLALITAFLLTSLVGCGPSGSGGRKTAITGIEAAKLLLAESDLTVSQISEMCGFSDASYFSFYFKKTFAVTPIEYRLTKKNEIAGKL